IYSEGRSPATGGGALSVVASSVGGTSDSTDSISSVYTDDPLDTGTGQTFNGFAAAAGLTRAAGSITQMNAFLVQSPDNYATGSPTPGAETVTGFYGFHCNDLKNKGTATACLQVGSQTAGALAINVASGGGTSVLQAVQATAVTVTPPAGDAGMIALPGNTVNQTIPTNQFAIGGFPSTSATAYGIQPPITAPGNSLPLFPTPTSGWSPWSWITLAGAGAAV